MEYEDNDDYDGTFEDHLRDRSHVLSEAKTWYAVYNDLAASGNWLAVRDEEIPFVLGGRPTERSSSIKSLNKLNYAIDALSDDACASLSAAYNSASRSGADLDIRGLKRAIRLVVNASKVPRGRPQNVAEDRVSDLFLRHLELNQHKISSSIYISKPRANEETSDAVNTSFAVENLRKFMRVVDPNCQFTTNSAVKQIKRYLKAKGKKQQGS